jgi:Uma2 family endonuclease
MGLTQKPYKQPPRTALEVFEMLPEGTLAEVINNVIYMSPAPSFPHQDLCTQLASLIRVHTSSEGTGKCIASPIDVYFDGSNVFQPDIIFISNENMGIVKDEKVKRRPRSDH